MCRLHRGKYARGMQDTRGLLDIAMQDNERLQASLTSRFIRWNSKRSVECNTVITRKRRKLGVISFSL